MQIQSLNCPNCSAPLRVEAGQVLAICVYCDSNIRISYPDAAPAQATKESTLSPEAISRIKQLLRSGKRAEAVQLYQTETHASRRLESCPDGRSPRGPHLQSLTGSAPLGWRRVPNRTEPAGQRKELVQTSHRYGDPGQVFARRHPPGDFR